MMRAAADSSTELASAELPTIDPAEEGADRPLSGTAPSTAAPMPSSSLLAGSLNLLNTIVGGGILSLPYAFKSCGMIIGILYQLVFGAASWYGCHLLLASVQPGKPPSYEGLAQLAFGRAGWLVYNLAALVNCYGACVSYVIVVGDVLAPICLELGVPLGRPQLLLLVVGVVIFPLSAMRDISSLR